MNPDVAQSFIAWQSLAVCRDYDPDMFFPELEGRGPRAQRRLITKVVDAQRVCSVCPVMMQCRREARRTQAVCGVWGGEFLGVVSAHRPTTRNGEKIMAAAGLA